jgi:hypothetical protein
MEFGSNLNRVFVENLRDPSLRKEAEERSQAYLKLRVYEDSFMARILPPKPISPSQCDRSIESPTLLRKIIDKEYTDVKATSMDFRGKGDYKFVDTAQYPVDFYKIESEEYHITEGELRAKEQPVQSLIKHHTAREIQHTMDSTFTNAVEAIIAAAEIAIPGSQLVSVPDDIILPSNLTKGTATTVCSAAIFASDWSMATIGLFGAPDITVDPYTKADTGQVKITLNQFYDFGIRQPAAFAKTEDLLA